MIMMGSQTKFGNIVHLIIGPETELIMDVHGSLVMDLTELIKTMPPAEKTLVNVSKCRTEPLTSQMLNMMGVPHTCTSMNVITAVNPNGQPPQTTKSEKPKGTCKLCGTPTDFAIPAVKLCDNCVQIELGLKHGAKHDQRGTV